MTWCSCSLVAVLLLSGVTPIRADADHCAVCGLQVEPGSRHFRTQDGHETYCERCFLSAPRCSRCKLPTATEAVDSTSGLCSRCLAKLPRCTACSKAITDTVYTFRFAPGKSCADCKQLWPPC